MPKLTRWPLAAVACFALSCTAAAQSAPPAQASADVPQWFAEMLDASKLPRMAGAQELFASKATTMLVVRDKVADAAAATRALLAADGWQVDESPSAQSADTTHAIMNFRKGEQGLNVFIGVAPAQGGATTIQYTPVVPDTARREAPQRREAQQRPARTAAETAMVDVSTLPRPEGAYVRDEDARKNEAHSFHYMVPGGIEQTKAAVTRLLAADGWIAYVEPLEKVRERNLAFKKGGQGVSMFFMTDGTNTTRSGVWMTSHRITTNVPFPPGATDVVYDYNRPLMDAIAPGTVESVLQFFRTELAALGWHDWSAEDAARYPDARLEEKIDDGVRAYFARDPRDRKDPIQVSLGRRNDGRVDIEVRVPPFARPQELSVSRETYGLPVPDRTKGSTGRDGQTQRELTAMVAAERDVVLKFYRRELGKLGWKEDARGPVSNDDDVVLNFTTADGKGAQLKLGFEYDLTTVTLTQQLPDKLAQARARAKQEAEEAARKRAEEWLNPPKALEAMVTPSDSPLPVPDSAEKVNFDASRGDVKFTSASRVKEIAAFYRKALGSLGFKENATPIDDDKMAALDFTRNGKRLYVSIMRIGERTDVRGYGPALLALAAAPRTQQAMQAAAQPALEDLEADTETTGLPVPKQVTMSFATGTPFGREREATVKASLESTLAFYRRELTRLGWKEESKGAVIKPNEARLAFTAPDGSGTLILGREDGKTTVKLTQRTPSEAQKQGIVAKPGMGMIVFGSALEAEAVVTIGRQTIKLPPGMDRQANGPKLDLKPGTYKASVKIPGKTFSEDIKVANGQTIGLLVGPGGLLSLPLN
jgi:hypothetical protein